MSNIKNTLKKAALSGTFILSMILNNGCATLEEQPEQEQKNKIILSKDYDSHTELSNSERVCFMDALKDVRQTEAQKYYYDKDKQTYALKCFDACGGAFIQRGKECKYMPSKYEFDKNACLCNGQNIIPHKEQETVMLELTACQQICESANTDDKKYTVDTKKTLPFGECVCKIVENNQQR